MHSVEVRNKFPSFDITKLHWFYFYRRYGAASPLSNSAGSSTASDLSRSRSSHTLKSRESSPLRSNATPTDGQDGAALSSWARYLKNKYGNRTSKDTRDAPTVTGGSQSPSAPSSSSPISRRLSLGLPLRQANEITSSDDDSKNVQGSPTATLVTIAVVVIFVAFVLLFCLLPMWLDVLCLFCFSSHNRDHVVYTWRYKNIYETLSNFFKKNALFDLSEQQQV